MPSGTSSGTGYYIPHGEIEQTGSENDGGKWTVMDTEVEQETPQWGGNRKREPSGG
ncbi:hypothetical protein FRC20_007873, partial [Serendipita sp. 405]